VNTSKAIGIDIGGTKTVVAAIDETGKIHARNFFETRSNRGFALGLQDIKQSIHLVLKTAGWPLDHLAGIGIGCTGPVNPQRGTLHNPFTLPGWDGADIVAPLRGAFDLPVRLENDADAAALGEAHFGAGRNANPLVMITLGTGVGGSALINGQIYRGVNGEHPEIGHLSVRPDGPECSCGTRGCWESLASGTAIAAAGQGHGFADSRAVFSAASTNPAARAIIQDAISATLHATWTLFHTLLPQRLVLGGGIGEEHFELFAVPIRGHLSRATQIPARHVLISKAELGNDAGVVGAASLFLKNINLI
jgi:glucokinase